MLVPGTKEFTGKIVYMAVFHFLSQLSRIGNQHLHPCRSRFGPDRFDRIHDGVTRDYGTKHDVFAIEPGGFGRAQKELRSVRVRSGIGHTQRPGSDMLLLKIFILKFGPVNRFTARTIPPRKVTTLCHKSYVFVFCFCVFVLLFRCYVIMFLLIAERRRK